MIGLAAARGRRPAGRRARSRHRPGPAVNIRGALWDSKKKKKRRLKRLKREGRKASRFWLEQHRPKLGGNENGVSIIFGMQIA